MKKVVILAAVLATVAVPLSLHAQTTALKIGYVDMQRAIVESDKGKEANQTIVKFAEGLKKNISDKEDELKKMKDALAAMDAPGSVVTDDARAEKKKQYEAKLKDYQRIVNDADGEMQQKQMEVGQKIYKEAWEIARDIGEKEKFTIILEKGQGVVLYAAPSIDITSKLIAQFNESSKNKSAPAKKKK